MSCYPILTPYPGTAFFEQFQREGRIRTYDWERYNGASVVYEPKRMTAKQLRHAQMAAFAEFYRPRSALQRLAVWPLKSRAWLANLACWQGIRYYYGARGRRVPAFRDFLSPHARAWDYPDEAWVAKGGEAAGGREAGCGGDCTATGVSFPSVSIDGRQPAALDRLAAGASRGRVMDSCTFT
jgi:hypothetical protein